jgi:ATP-dependent exoDNAse (exonuclease V) alpha subunit
MGRPAGPREWLSFCRSLLPDMEIEISPAFENVLRFVNETNSHVFLTGKAGTGKTTLLKYIRERSVKQMAVCAPTGVAAINAGGTTLHSFFQFAFGPFVPHLNGQGEADYSRGHLPAQKYNSQRLNLMRNLELLIIDEISMVRADLLDQVDAALRQARRKWHLPFGGVQLLMIGDMHQLPPVVPAEEWQLLKAVYRSPYFFDSLVVRRFPPVYIELEKIYRQKDDRFISLLNQVRSGRMDQESLNAINSHYRPVLGRQVRASAITLTTHNRNADEINVANLAAIPGKAFEFKAEIEGTFPEKSYPAEENLALKPGCRVMFIRNNAEKNYYNGKTGIVTVVTRDEIVVSCEEGREKITVARETWQNISYSVEKSTKQVKEEVLGTFTQYPLRLAWAITIHKSQGLTFDKVIVDAAESFSAGQVYVALSRCRTLDGLILSSKIRPGSLRTDEQVGSFSATRQSEEQITQMFSRARRDYSGLLLMEIFDFFTMQEQRKQLAGTLQVYSKHVDHAGRTWAEAFFSRLDVLADVAAKFSTQLTALVQGDEPVETNSGLQERLRKATGYFLPQLADALGSLAECALRTESLEASKEMTELVKSIHDALYLRQEMMKAVMGGFSLQDFTKKRLQVVYPEFRPRLYASAPVSTTPSGSDHPALYDRLLAVRNRICEESGLPIYMVAPAKTLTQLCEFLPVSREELLMIAGFGKARVGSFGEQFLEEIREYLAENGISSSFREKAGNRKKLKHPPGEEPARPAGRARGDTRRKSFELFERGLSAAEIAKERGVTVGTVESHLVPYVAEGRIDLRQLVSPEKEMQIRKNMEEAGQGVTLSAIKSRLGDSVSWSEIRFVMAAFPLQQEGVPGGLSGES